MNIEIENTTFRVNQNLVDINDYLTFKDTIKTHVEQYINQTSKKPDIQIIFGCNVTTINSISLGFMLWLIEEYANSLSIEVCNKTLYDFLGSIGLTAICSVKFNGKE